jgi:hypothetical protein
MFPSKHETHLVNKVENAKKVVFTISVNLLHHLKPEAPPSENIRFSFPIMSKGLSCKYPSKSIHILDKWVMMKILSC